MDSRENIVSVLAIFSLIFSHFWLELLSLFIQVTAFELLCFSGIVHFLDLDFHVNLE